MRLLAVLLLLAAAVVSRAQTTTTSSSTTSTLPPLFDCTGPTMTEPLRTFVKAALVVNNFAGSFRARMPLPLAGFDPIVDGMELAFVQTSSGTQMLRLYGENALPPGGPGSGCDPRDGWQPRDTGFVYRNFSTDVPPCGAHYIPLRLLRVFRRGDEILVRGRLHGAYFNAYAGPELREAINLGRGSGTLAAGRCGTAQLACTVYGYPDTLRCEGQ